MAFFRVAILITTLIFPVAVFAQVGPCGSGDTCPSGQICRGPEGSRLCYRTCNPAASAGATDACPERETCGRPEGFTEDVCELGAASSSRSESSSDEAPEEAPFEPITPSLGVPIPGAALSAPTRESGVMRVAFLGEYINAAYRYLSTIGLVIAIVMVVYGGFLYLGGSAGIGSIQRGKTIIVDAIIGMLLILSAYAILNVVNPDTVNLKTLELAFVQPLSDEMMESIESELRAEEAESSPAGGDVTVNLDDMERLDTECVHLNTPADPSVIDPLRRAGERFCELRGSNRSWRIVGGGYRSATLSLKLWLRRCLNKVNCTIATGPPNPRSLVTRSSDGRWTLTDAELRTLIPPVQPGTYTDSQIDPIFRRLESRVSIPATAGHGRGLALDLYCGGAARSQMDMHVRCQLLLEQAMKEAGFCRIPNEWWHFELANNHPSRSCNPNWTIGTAMIPLGEGEPREVDYRSCDGYFSFSRARAGQDPCH